MSEVAKRTPPTLVVLVFGLVMAACTVSAPPSSQAVGPLPAYSVGGVFLSMSPAAVLQTSILTAPRSATIGKYGTRTKATFSVEAVGSRLRYTWQHRAGSGKAWKTIPRATSRTYTAKAKSWTSGTQFRVVVAGKLGKEVSSPAKLTVVLPTKTPARDAGKAFGLTGLTQGLDLSSYQYAPSEKIKMKAVAGWAGKDGFVILRNGSGARPIKQAYIDGCTNKPKKTGIKPITQDCAYPKLADQAKTARLSLGHYWFNGWIDTIDTTKKDLFAGGYTVQASARQFVKWIKSDGNYTKSSTDPLVLDIEAGRTWTKTSGGKTYRKKLRAWNPAEATVFLTTVRAELIEAGYQANLYVYMSANVASARKNGVHVWSDVAGLARLWVASWGTNNGRIPSSQPEVGPWADHGGWSLWQYTSNARFSGSGVGALDGDIAKADAWIPR